MAGCFFSYVKVFSAGGGEKEWKCVPRDDPAVVRNRARAAPLLQWGLVDRQSHRAGYAAVIVVGGGGRRGAAGDVGRAAWWGCVRRRSRYRPAAGGLGGVASRGLA